MPIPTFTPPATAPLDPGARRSNKPKVLMAQFGDGFAQRARDGLNNNPLRRDFSWSNLTKEEAEAIDEFFLARRGEQSFYYQKPDESRVRAYICPEWEVTHVAYSVYNVTASFVEVFDIET